MSCEDRLRVVILLLLLSYLLAGTALIPGVVLLFFVLHLEPNSGGGRIIESVGVSREQTLQS